MRSKSGRKRPTRPKVRRGAGRSVLTSQKVRRTRRRRNPFAVLKSLGLSFFKISVFAVLLGVVSLGFIYSYEYFMKAPFLELKEIKIRCQDPHLAEKVKQICRFPKGTTVVAVNLERLKREIEKDPWVRSAVVERRFPHTLMVEVHSHEPIAFVVLKAKLYLMSERGVLFKEVSGEEGLDLPVVTGLSEDGIRAFPSQEEWGRKLSPVLNILKALKDSEDPWSVAGLSEIHVRGGERFSLYFDRLRAEVRLTARDLGLKLKRLSRVVAHLSKEGVLEAVSRIDLQGRGGAVVSFSNGPSHTRRG